ncbi:DcrB-related protein [Acetobacter thailandicus]|uniref:DcrB-related protein n=1 Tax=Acetobacter thailandicus TaxID=1502842 RepID=UPI001BA62A51|nr:DcrB-related protein [Acetobacter thailandicus]MBS0959131.1 DcrB-related protein [Acetobacter thailandicus]
MDYHIQEASFDLPAGFVDQSINVLTITPENGEPFSLMITRRVLIDSETLPAYIARTIINTETEENFFKFLWKRFYTIQERPCFILATLIGNEKHPSEQRRIYIQNNMQVLTFIATVQKKFSEAQLNALNNLSKSFQFKD